MGALCPLQKRDFMVKTGFFEGLTKKSPPNVIRSAPTTLQNDRAGAITYRGGHLGAPQWLMVGVGSDATGRTVIRQVGDHYFARQNDADTLQTTSKNVFYGVENPW